MATHRLLIVLIAFVVESVIVSGQQVSQKELEHFNLLNELRAAGFTCPEGQRFVANPVPLKFDCRLWRASQLHSQDMADQDYFSHTSKDGRSFVDRGQAQGIFPNAENIAAGRGSAQEVLDQWKVSDGHCRNMLNPSRKLFAVAYGFNSGSRFKHYWTQMLKNTEVAVDESCLVALATSSTTTQFTTSTTIAATTTATTVTTITSTSITGTTTTTGTTTVSTLAIITKATTTSDTITATTTATPTATTPTTFATSRSTITTTTTVTILASITTGTTVTNTDASADPTTTSIVTTGITTTTRMALVRGSLVLNVSNIPTFASDAFPNEEFKAALVAAIAQLAGVDINAVVVTFTKPRRLQSGIEVSSTIAAEYTISVLANEASAVVQRIVSTELSLATSMVTQWLSDANFDSVVGVLSFSANIVAHDSDADKVIDKFNIIGVLIGGGIGAIAGFILLLCCCCSYRCCCHGSHSANKPKKSSLPVLVDMEEGIGATFPKRAIT